MKEKEASGRGWISRAEGCAVFVEGYMVCRAGVYISRSLSGENVLRIRE